MNTINNSNIDALKPLITPDALMQQLPTTTGIHAHVKTARDTINAILRGEDKRLLVIIGPCSIHDHEASITYARKLKALADRIDTEIYIVMRVYFEKPRTTVGWKGYINDPHLNGSSDINEGLLLARKLLLEINQLGLAVATEFLDTMTPQYIADLIAWGAIGARTAESQLHRNLASGLSMPIGIKNSTSGDIQVAVDAVYAAMHAHTFFGITAKGQASIVSTKGNPDGHVILRGSSHAGPNYDADSVAQTIALLKKVDINQKIIIDCSHGNSNKDHRQQNTVLQSVLQQRKNQDNAIAGVMIESNLLEGKQVLSNTLNYGQSITDACIGWETTEKLLTAAQLSERAA